MKIKNVCDLNLSKEEYLQIKSKNKEIGRGEEGIIYKASNGTLLKLYHAPEESFFDIKHPLVIQKTAEDDVKTFDRKAAKEYNDLLFSLPYYIDVHGVKKLYNSYPIKEARKRQDYVENTILPLGCIYVDGRFYGAILKRHNFHSSIFSLKLLPIEIRKKIVLQLLKNVRELCDNNIYHLDLSRPYEFGRGKGNVLISPKGKVEIIDLDGKSTIYSGEYDVKLEKICYYSLNSLVADLMFDLDLKEDFSVEDLSMLEIMLKSNGIDTYLVQKFLDLNANHEELTEIIKRAK